MNKEKKMPVYGVGPIYGITVILLTISFILLDIFNILDSGKLSNNILKIVFIILGIILLIYGFVIWVICAFGRNSIDKYIKEDKLYTGGVYAYCRNPIYTAIGFMATGLILFTQNLYGLILPVVYYLFITILMINTEEKWLEDKFGEEYLIYKKQTNRCIPWFPKKRDDKK